ncbi:hypothetical protein ACFY30_38760 [Streptomyces sp. NPDC000345]|uniref:hypothetical protein n=1 Tax=Streptomyces sp. NPDC000345 TaxID=3364537 RepID=UPI0036CD1E88
MAGTPQGKEPKLARTDFESMTHEQLAAMLDSASSESASTLASKLTKAASTITKIGDDLMTHVKGLEWQGEGGDAFRDWGGQTASATLRLGQYAEVASRWMETVAQAVAEAKAAMPKVSETTQAQADLADAKSTMAAAKQPGARNDPDARTLAQTAQTDATAAQARIEAARAEAIQQMQKLAQAYEYSAQQVNSVEPPTFSPPAGNTGSSGWWVEPDSDYVSTGSQYAQSGTGGLSSTTSHTSGGGAGGHASIGSASRTNVDLGTTGTSHQPTRTVPAADMEIDGVGTLPDTSLPATAPPSAGPQTAPPRPEPAPTVQPGVVPPAFGGGGGGTNPVAPGRMPSTSRLPQLPGQGITNGAAARLPRESGILGGRPVTPGAGRSTGIPRGTVIGGGTAQGRAPMMRGMTPGMQGTGGGSAGGGLTGGRRLASESGGIVGSRPQPGRTNPRPFTPGGSGLVRPAAGSAAPEHGPAAGRSGANAHPSNAPGSRRDQQHGRRPDYLVEDEETWAANNRRAVPPVVD